MGLEKALSYGQGMQSCGRVTSTAQAKVETLQKFARCKTTEARLMGSQF